jgi:hypothetical protein
MTYQPNYYNISIQSIFVTDGIENRFEGLEEEIKTNEYRFIVRVLYDYFGIDVEFKEALKKGNLVIAFLSFEQMKILRGIYEDTLEYPIKYGRSYLKFETDGYVYDKPPCDQNCDCCECLDCCGY